MIAVDCKWIDFKTKRQQLCQLLDNQTASRYLFTKSVVHDVICHRKPGSVQLERQRQGHLYLIAECVRLSCRGVLKWRQFTSSGFPFYCRDGSARSATGKALENEQENVQFWHSQFTRIEKTHSSSSFSFRRSLINPTENSVYAIWQTFRWIIRRSVGLQASVLCTCKHRNFVFALFPVPEREAIRSESMRLCDESQPWKFSLLVACRFYFRTHTERCTWHSVDIWCIYEFASVSGWTSFSCSKKSNSAFVFPSHSSTTDEWHSFRLIISSSCRPRPQVPGRDIQPRLAFRDSRAAAKPHRKSNSWRMQADHMMSDGQGIEILIDARCTCFDRFFMALQIGEGRWCTKAAERWIFMSLAQILKATPVGRRNGKFLFSFACLFQPNSDTNHLSVPSSSFDTFIVKFKVISTESNCITSNDIAGRRCWVVLCQTDGGKEEVVKRKEGVRSPAPLSAWRGWRRDRNHQHVLAAMTSKTAFNSFPLSLVSALWAHSTVSSMRKEIDFSVDEPREKSPARVRSVA